MKKLLLAVFLIGAGLSLGINLPSGGGVPSVDEVVLSESLQPSVEAWKNEVRRKYADAVIVFGHGATNCPSRWMIVPDRRVVDAKGGVSFEKEPAIEVEVVVENVKRRWPGRLIVLMTCNPFHFRPDWSGVVYASEDVYTVPDHVNRPDGTGSIFEFRGP